jgi:hypothetical protein
MSAPLEPGNPQGHAPLVEERSGVPKAIAKSPALPQSSVTAGGADG